MLGNHIQGKTRPELSLRRPSPQSACARGSCVTSPGTDSAELCCPILVLCGEGELAEVGCAGTSEWCAGPPGVEADEVDGGGGVGVFEVDFGLAGVSGSTDPGDGDHLMDGALDPGAGVA